MRPGKPHRARLGLSRSKKKRPGQSLFRLVHVFRGFVRVDRRRLCRRRTRRRPGRRRSGLSRCRRRPSLLEAGCAGCVPNARLRRPTPSSWGRSAESSSGFAPLMRLVTHCARWNTPAMPVGATRNVTSSRWSVMGSPTLSDRERVSHRRVNGEIVRQLRFRKGKCVRVRVSVRVGERELVLLEEAPACSATYPVPRSQAPRSASDRYSMEDGSGSCSGAPSGPELRNRAVTKVRFASVS